MKIGLMFANSGPMSDPKLFAHLVKTAENCGIESIWTVEHVVIPRDYKSVYPYSSSGRIPGNENVPIPDPLLHLAFAASITSKLKLGTGVLILPQRHPLYTAKEVASLDVLSGGRVLLGIGSGWLQEEFTSLNLNFHSRGKMTDEAIESLRALWRDDPSSFHGQHYNFGPVSCFPKPIQKGGVPILIGGHSLAAAKRAARYGDGFFPALGEPAKLQELFALMKAECAKIGRNPAEIELSCMGRAKSDSIKALADIGVSRVVVPPPGYEPDAITRGLEKIGKEIIARV
ncbi:MAG TPA: LLM class F420-dependent oxidoreductase [Candidatus Binataceae bacterium]